ncbi:MAG: bile acid:sodium symporter family protein [Myxococcota bacterium]
MIARVTQLFPLWAVLASALALALPELFTPLRPAIVPMLGVVMFSMGMTLRPESFREVVRRPAAVMFGLVLQFGLMPLLAWLVAQGLGLSAELAAGLILVGSCPGGTASNVICYLARADVALSITLTSVSTLLAVVATPLLTQLYSGKSVEVDVVGMILSILRVVILPVVLGVATNTVLGARLERLTRLFPLVSVLAIILIIAIIVGLNRERVLETSALVVLAVALHNGLGLLGGYGLAHVVGFDPKRCRTLAIEVGMQNSGLAVVLASHFFSPLAALPGALFSIWHNLSGSLLAAFWSRPQRS